MQIEIMLVVTVARCAPKLNLLEFKCYMGSSVTATRLEADMLVPIQPFSSRPALCASMGSNLSKLTRRYRIGQSQCDLQRLVELGRVYLRKRMYIEGISSDLLELSLSLVEHSVVDRLAVSNVCPVCGKPLALSAIWVHDCIVVVSSNQIQ